MFSRTTMVLFLLAILGISLWPGIKLLPDEPGEKVIAQSEETLLIPAASTTATVSLTPTLSVTPPETTTATVTTTPGATATEEPTTTPTATVTVEPTVTPSPTATVTPTMTPVPAAGTLAGTVTLQGRRNWAGVQIEADNVVVTTTASDGTFSVDLQPGTYLVRARIAGYLPAEKPGVEITSEQTTTLPTVTLRGGDVNGDNKVGLRDLVIVAAAYDTAPPADPRGDINNDGRIDIFDLVLVASNYWLDGPLPWPETR